MSKETCKLNTCLKLNDLWRKGAFELRKAGISYKVTLFVICTDYSYATYSVMVMVWYPPHGPLKSCAMNHCLSLLLRTFMASTVVENR
jgi:hypothetical protein